MEWFKILSQLVSNLVWPTVVLTIVLIFRRELTNVLGAIKEVKYPGGSVTLEIDRLKQRIEKSSVRFQHSVNAGMSTEVPSIAADPQLAIAQLRTEVEKELVHLSRHAPSLEQAERWEVERRISGLQAAGIINSDFAASLLFIKIKIL